MINNAPTFCQPDRLWPEVALRCAVLIVVALFPSAAPNIGLLALTESEAPLDAGKSAEEAAIAIEAAPQLRRHPARPRLLVTVHRQADAAVGGDFGRAPRSGHRLPNNLLAPLRC